MEKSPGTKLEETEKLAQTAKDKGCKTMVGFNRRFCPLVRKAKEMVEKKEQIIQSLVSFTNQLFPTMILFAISYTWLIFSGTYVGSLRGYSAKSLSSMEIRTIALTQL